MDTTQHLTPLHPGPGERLVTLPAGEPVLVRPKPFDAVPESYVHDVEVRRDLVDGKPVSRKLRMEYFYVWQDVEVDHFLAWAEGQKTLGYDTETSGISVYDHEVATIQFGNPFHPVPRSYTIDVRGLSAASLARIMALVADPTITKLGQNIKFECLYAQHRLRTKPRTVACTQVTELVLRAGLFPGDYGEEGADGQSRKAYSWCSMAKLCQRYLNIDIDKDHDLRTSFYTTPVGAHTPRQVIYAGSDTIYPWYIAAEQLVEINDRKLRSIVKLEFELIPVLVDTELAGINIDTVAWRKLYQEAIEKQDLTERELDRLFLNLQGELFATHNEHVRPIYLASKTPQPLNWSSTHQLKWAIARYCETIKWPIKVLTTFTQVLNAKLSSRDGKYWMEKRGLAARDLAQTQKAADEGGLTIPDYVLEEGVYCILLKADAKTLTLRKLRGQLPDEFVEKYLAWAELKALTTTFGVDYLKNLKADGRIHVEFHQLIAATGRMSTTPQLQNIPRPKPYRQAFKAKKGYRFAIADYSSVEPRISADVSKDEVYIANYLTDGDIYISVGQAMLGREIIRDTPQGDADRQASKSTVLGMAYRMGIGKLRDKLSLDLQRNVSFDEAAQLHKAYVEQCAGIIAFQAECSAYADPATSTRKVWDRMLGCEVTYVTSPCGRHRFFPPDARNTFTESCNHPIQACSATITKAAAVLIQRYIDEHGIDAHGVNFVHDEMLYEVREDQAESFALAMRAIMEKAGQFYVPSIPIKADFPKGTNGVVPYWTK